MLLLAFIAIPLFVYWGWRTGDCIRRKKYFIIYLCVILSMASFRWATAPSANSYIPATQPTSEQVGANMICLFIALYGARKLGGRLRDTGIKERWVIVMALLSPTGIPWIIALFYPSSRVLKVTQVSQPTQKPNGEQAVDGNPH